MSNGYRVVFRDETQVPQGIDAHVVNGWKSDYAFMDVDGGVVCLIPREIVARVDRLRRYEETEVASTRHPLADDEERAYAWFNNLSGEARFGLLPMDAGTADPQKWWDSLCAHERIALVMQHT